MIYQFEHEEIKRCRECPMCGLCNLDAPICYLQDKMIAFNSTPQENNCPLVAISKTATTSEPCDCISDGYEKLPVVTVGIRRVVEHTDKPYYMAQSLPLGYCPNCGRKLTCPE